MEGSHNAGFKPYQLKPKRGNNVEPPIEEPLADPKKLKRMKKKLDELNRKIRHSRKKHDGLIHKRNSLRRVIEELKQGNRQRNVELAQVFVECERAFRRAYRSYRANGRPRMDVDTFFSRVRGDLISLIARELISLNSARVQTTAWIRFTKDDDRFTLAFNSRMTDVYQGSDLDQIVDGMIAHMGAQTESPALLNSRFRFDKVLFLDVNFHQLNLTRGSSYLLLPDWIARKKAIVNPQNDDEECFKWAVITASVVGRDTQCVSKLKRFGAFDGNNNVSINILVIEEEHIYIC